MHGQKRSEYKSRLLNPETSSKLATKAQHWNHLSHELLTQRRRLFSPQARPDPEDDGGVAHLPPPKPSPEILLSITEKMLSVNPDPSHLWNIRREMLLYSVQPGAAAAMDNATKKSHLNINAELSLTAHCLQRNPKSYSAWYHRKWSLVHSITHPILITATITADDNGDVSSSNNNDNNNDNNNSSATGQLHSIEGHFVNMKAILKSELELCAQFLQLDERNFHCWNYRRFVVALLGSCGGSGGSTTTSTSYSPSSDMVDESDGDLFNGSWSPWLNQSTTVSMGAQSSSSGRKATGNVPHLSGGHQRGDGGDDEEFNNIAKSIFALSPEELTSILISEWNFTTSKIHDNFSNGSAFHYRSKLLPLILESRLMASSTTSLDDEGYRNKRYDAILTLAREEWESILLNAIFTEPDDQTPWWYHRFIVSWIKPTTTLGSNNNSSNNIISINDDDGNGGTDDGAAVDDEMLQECETLLLEMADSLRELLEVEKENDVLPPDGDDTTNNNNKDESKGVKCKWAYLGLHLVLSTILELFESSSMDEESVTELKMEAKMCVQELIRIDPNRKERYQNLVAELM